MQRVGVGVEEKEGIGGSQSLPGLGDYMHVSTVLTLLACGSQDWELGADLSRILGFSEDDGGGLREGECWVMGYERLQLGQSQRGADTC